MVVFTVSACETDQTAFRPPTAATTTTTPTTTAPTTTTTTTLASQISIWDAGSAGADLIQLNSDERAVAADLSIMTTGAQQAKDCTTLEEAVQTLSSDPPFPDPIANAALLNEMADFMIAAQACVNSAESGLNAVYQQTVIDAINTGVQDYLLYKSRVEALIAASNDTTTTA